MVVHVAIEHDGVKGQEGLLFVIDLNGVRTVERWCCW
jgi:hypothetical protein